MPRLQAIQCGGTGSHGRSVTSGSCDRLLEGKDWSGAANAYAADHDDFFQRLRRAERLNATLHFSMGDKAESRRQRAYALMDQYPELNPDVSGLGPEARCSDHVINTLLGEEYAVAQ